MYGSDELPRRSAAQLSVLLDDLHGTMSDVRGRVDVASVEVAACGFLILVRFRVQVNRYLDRHART